MDYTRGCEYTIESKRSCYAFVTYPGHDRTNAENRAALMRRTQRAAEKRALEARNRALNRARQLLLLHLLPEQRREYETSGRFTISTRSGRRYVIEKGCSHGSYNVMLAGGILAEHQSGRLEIGDRLCVYFADRNEEYPDDDRLLAQKLCLEANEEYFLRLACVRRPASAPAPDRAQESAAWRRVRGFIAASDSGALWGCVADAGPFAPPEAAPEPVAPEPAAQRGIEGFIAACEGRRR